MIRTALALFALIATVPAAAQTPQDALDGRYDRALAAGYKALMLCGAIGHAERVGVERTEQSVLDMELSGIQSPLDSVIGDLDYEIKRDEPVEFMGPDNGFLNQVQVEWADDMPPRIAAYRQGRGCALMPIGMTPDAVAPGPSPRRSRTSVLDAAPLPAVAALTEQVSRAMDGTYGEGTRTTATVVSLRGRVATEQYAAGFSKHTPQRTWSVAKSIAATIIGVASHQGAIDVADPAGLGISQSDPRAQITIDHLLRMASGRYSDSAGNRTDPLYWGGTSVDERAKNWPLISPPGSVYRYANNDTLMAIAPLRPWINAQRPERLFDFLGMFDATAETDWQGNYVLSSQVWASSADLLSFGELYLTKGAHWSGERRFAESWVEYVAAPSGPQPEGRPFGYGAGFWLLNNSPGVPADTFAALGNRGQYVVIVPSRDVVIVRRGEDPVGSRFDIAAFTRDVLAALE